MIDPISGEATQPKPLPLLPTMGVGSYAAPGWCLAGLKLSRSGELGPHDAEELFEDVTRIVLLDQIEAGVDILTDGELRRQRFVFDVFSALSGVERVPGRRKIGVHGYDMVPHFVAADVVSAPSGLGVVEEFRTLQRLAPGRATKIAIPGPLTFAGFVRPGDRDPAAIVEEMIAIVRDELQALSAAGADYVQLDEPGLPTAPYGLSMTDAASVINRAIDGIEIRSAVHVCFGNNAGRPMADRRMDRLMPAIQALSCDQLVLEFANREMAEIELLAALAEDFDIAAGVVDVKNWFVESTDDVARRLDMCLSHMPAERLSVTADCGFSALSRQVAREKMQAMVDGAALVRGRL